MQPGPEDGRRRYRLMRLMGLMSAVACVMAPAASAGHFTTGNEEVLLTNQEWKGTEQNPTGLQWWPDGPMGIERDGSTYTFHTPNGRNVARTVGTLYNPIATSIEPVIEVEGARDLVDVGYASGGPIYKVPGTSTRLMFVHLERYPGDTHAVWYSPVGLAKSVDGGQTWQFLGEILSHDISYEEYRANNPCGNVGFNTGFGQYLIRQVDGVEYFYVYGYNTNVEPTGCTTPFAVARAPVAEVVAAAANNSVSPWVKHYQGAWSQPGIGGKASNVLPPGAAFGPHSVGFNTYRNRYVMAIARSAGSVLGLKSSTVDLYESVDGVSWSGPESLPTVVGEIYAPTIVGLGADPATPGKLMYIYYTYSLQGGWDRFNSSDLRRRAVTYR